MPQPHPLSILGSSGQDADRCKPRAVMFTVSTVGLALLTDRIPRDVLAWFEGYPPVVSAGLPVPSMSWVD